MKLEIINSSRAFVARFWIAKKKKLSAGTFPKNVEFFNGRAEAQKKSKT